MSCKGCEHSRKVIKYYIDRILSIRPNFDVSKLRLGEAKRIARQLRLNCFRLQSEEASAILYNEAAQKEQGDG